MGQINGVAENILLNTDVTDYIVEQGTDGIWTYRKWHSGISECWGKWEGILTDYSGHSDFYFYTADIEFPKGLFISIPTPTYSAAVADYFCTSGLVFKLSKDGMSCYAMSTVGGENAVTFYINSKGKWK